MAAVVRPGRLSGVQVAAAATAAPLAAAAAGQGWDTAGAAYWTWAAASLSIQRAVLSEDDERSEQEDYQRAGETENREVLTAFIGSCNGYAGAK